jgi:hypothetical protein
MLLTMTACVLMAAYRATKAAAGVRDDLLAACRQEFGDLSDEQIAVLLGISRGQFADQKALNQHLSAYRIADLPDPIRVRFHTLQLKRLHRTVFDNLLLDEFLSAALESRRRRQLTTALAREREQEIA